MKAIITTVFRNKDFTETIDVISTTKHVLHVTSDTTANDSFSRIDDICKRMVLRNYILNHFNFQDSNEIMVDETNNTYVSTAVYTTE